MNVRANYRFLLGAVLLAAGIVVWQWPMLRDVCLRRIGLSVARLECPSTIDLGEKEVGERVSTLIEIRNRGGEVLVIDRIKTNCSCSGLEIEKDGQIQRPLDFRIEPGQAQTVSFRVTVGGAPVGAEMINVIEFATNDPARPMARIVATVKCIHGGVSCLPLSVAFGKVALGSPVKQLIHLYDHSVLPREIQNVVSSDPKRVSVKLLPPSAAPSSIKDLSGKLIGHLEVSVDTSETGEINAQIQLHLKNGSRRPDMIPVQGVVAAPVEWQPSRLLLPRRSADGPIFWGLLTLRGSHNQPVVVETQTIPPNFAVDLLPQTTRDVQQARVTWRPPKNVSSMKASRTSIVFQVRVGLKKHTVEVPVILQPVN